MLLVSLKKMVPDCSAAGPEMTPGRKQNIRLLIRSLCIFTLHWGRHFTVSMSSVTKPLCTLLIFFWQSGISCWQAHARFRKCGWQSEGRGLGTKGGAVKEECGGRWNRNVMKKTPGHKEKARTFDGYAQCMEHAQCNGRG